MAALPQIASPPQASAEVLVNQNFVALEHQAVYGYDALGSSGLVWAYLGGRWAGTTVAAGALTLTASATNYIVANRSTAVISVATTTTNWNDTTSYGRVYSVVTGGSAVTSSADYRGGTNGVHGSVAGAGAGTVSSVALTLPSIFAVAGSPVTSTGTLAGTLATQTANTGFFGPASGSAAAPAFRALVLADLPAGATAPVTTKGDLYSFSTVGARLPVGTDGYALVADSTQTLGLKYAQVGYINVPLNSQSAAYTTVLSDQGKCIFHPASDTSARTWTIDSNANVAYPIGTVLTFDNDIGAGTITIAITSDTLVLVGSVGSTGSRTLAAGGQASAIKVASTRWRISGVGLT